MKDSWKPVNHNQLVNLLTHQNQQLADDQKVLWDTIRLPFPELWQQHPWGDEGCGFWVIAVAGRSCIYFNDISGGFSCGTFQRWGKIDTYKASDAALPGALHTLFSREETQETA